MTCGEANSDLDLAWKMLGIANAIVAKSPEKTMEKVNISYALAEVSMKRGSSVILLPVYYPGKWSLMASRLIFTFAEDRDSAIGYYLEGLAILEHLVRPDDFRVARLYPFCCDSSANHSAVSGVYL